MGYSRIISTDEINFANNIKALEKEVDRLSDKDKEQIGWWYDRLFEYIKDTCPIERFMI